MAAPGQRLHILDRKIAVPGSSYAYPTTRDTRVGIVSASSNAYAAAGGRTTEVSLSAFSFLLSEMVQHVQARVTSIDALERRLEEAGYAVGLRVLELQQFRDKSVGKRKTRLLQALQWVSADMWRALFGKTADSLERSTENADEYMIHELQPITNVFVSVPPDLGQLNCAAYIAGIIAGALDGACFPATVTAHTIELAGQEANITAAGGPRCKTVFLVKFSEEVMRREAQLA
ncbi:transport protein particle component [Tribonema minus]|uniref:Transport protein particle component n=1 Tax=Tribonema minus TaxID=303371 RepID=A0A836CAJ0_9STRA|nr:transport protein particle component [Tribonema minus]